MIRCVTSATTRLMLLDTASLYFRAYFGVPESVRAPDGTPVNAVRGLLDFIARLVTDHRPGALVACMDDDWRPVWRVELIPSYKAHRVAEEAAAGPDTEIVPDTLSPQVPVIEEVLDAIGIVRLGAPWYEADDVIGTLSARAAGPVDIVTGDRDLFQLIDDARSVRVLYPVKGMGTLASFDEAALREKYGVDGPGYADLALLRGDPSDGLPGVAGIGEKTAAQVVSKFGSWPELIGAVVEGGDPRMSSAVRSKMIKAADYLAVAPSVVRVAPDAPIDWTGERRTLPHEPVDPDGLAALAERWNLAGSVDRLLAALRGDQ
jgi:5'-3' exonuclease